MEHDFPFDLNREAHGEQQPLHADDQNEAGPDLQQEMGDTEDELEDYDDADGEHANLDPDGEHGLGADLEQEIAAMEEALFGSRFQNLILGV
ncbi:hypothetical protein ACP70R_030131 [Stipagrostis hirtigluma subsp. patula]